MIKTILVLLFALCACVDMRKLDSGSWEWDDKVTDEEELANVLRSLNDEDEEVANIIEVDESKLDKRQYVAQTGYDAVLDLKCNAGSAINFITSVHHNHFEDRRWTIGCAPTGIAGKPMCSRTPFMNDWDGAMNYRCPYNGYIAGVYSVHHNHYEDRRWKVDCCFIPGRCMRDCKSSQKNDWDAQLFYAVPGGKLLRGMISEHHNHYEDRRYSFESCRSVAC